MRRREFIAGAAMLAPAMQHAIAQKSAPTKRLAVVSPNQKLADWRSDPNDVVFVEELKRLGYVDGENLIIDRYSAEGEAERYRDLAREVVSTHPDVIYSLGSPLTRQFRAATSTIPIVAFTGDPVRLGLIASLAHPGGNITGVSADAGLEIWGKRLALLVEAVPKIAHVMFVGTPGAWENPGGKSVRAVAQTFKHACACLGSSPSSCESSAHAGSFLAGRVMRVAPAPGT
jgi:putative ABC transport system substrate-binding protein